MQGRDSLEMLLKDVLFLPPEDQVRLASMWIRRIEGNRSLQQEIYLVVARAVNPVTNLESWMESRLKKNMSLTPHRVAYECRYYKRVRREMTPYLIHLARKVKDRLRKRMVKEKVL
jgi:16S rRNA G527 N7-methylase RsmG